MESKNTNKNGRKADHGLSSKPINRKTFLKGVGVGAASLGIASLGFGGTAKAQEPLSPEQINPADFLTLAAFVDTIVPGVQGVPVDVKVMDPQSGQLVTIGTLQNLGAQGTDTPGAANIPQSYLYLYNLLPKAGHDPLLVQKLISALDDFAKQLTQNPNASFHQLPYDVRYQILYLMDKPDLLAAQGIPIEQAAALKQLLTVSSFFTFFIYYSEYCNIVPAGYDPSFRPLFQRNKAGGWDLIPNSSWDQLGYPGPSHKEPDYASDYDGLRVTIADGKVKFQS